ncbi:hypothetical protein [Brenneria corticis]|uniref:Uncharacterized protein n=1 Tax=Brenneria corticis TaxID=2173106 RepID=A0A2U1TM68_9GAMM|nr:hypothetical protein [Brenneria sp. CFCC 11842]PWC10520.1 hypothetical protein DDT56_21645 [Brenneria sp. CFCC 11842]
MIVRTEDVKNVADIIGRRLDIPGEDTRVMAITGALLGTVTAFYSRKQSPSEKVVREALGGDA